MNRIRASIQSAFAGQLDASSILLEIQPSLAPGACKPGCAPAASYNARVAIYGAKKKIGVAHCACMAQPRARG
jgi:hypothetical protein